MPYEVMPGIWFHHRNEIGILADVQLTMGAAQQIGRQHYSTGQELGRDDLYEWCREIDAYHRDHNGWLGFGYSFAVGRDRDPEKGHILEGRGWGAIGAHTLGHNEDLGCCFLGNDDPGVQDATPGVRRALRLLFSSQPGGWNNRTLREVHGHRETYQTDCPGDELENWVRSGLPITPAQPTPTPPQPIRPPTGWVATGKSGWPVGHPISFAWLSTSGKIARRPDGSYVFTNRTPGFEGHEVDYGYMSGVHLIEKG